MLVSEAMGSLIRDFRKRAIRIGRRYQGQSVALIALCRHLVEGDTNPKGDGLQIILQLADNALLAAKDAGKDETSAANDAFEIIRDRLERYPMATQDSQKLFNVFKDACSKDQAATERIRAYNEKSSPFPRAGACKKINFVILKSWCWDPPPTVVKEEIDDPTPVAQILWIFSHRKGEGRITLKENPHFYLEIPQEGSKSEFDSLQDGKGFHRDPLTQIGPGLGQNDTVYVLLDKSCRLYLDVGKPRVFGNLWHPQKRIILKDICGVLDSEDNIRPSFEKEMLDFWYRRSSTNASQPPVRSFDQQHYSDNDRRIIETRFGDWCTLVHAAVNSQDIDLMIRAKKSRPDPPQDWKLLPPPERPRVAPQKSREHSQKRHRAATAGKSATCYAADQNSSSLSDATSKPVASSTTSINMTVDISSTTLVVTAATSNCHLLPHDGTRDVKCGDSHTSSHPPTSNPQKGRGTEPSRPSIPGTPQTFTPALSTPTPSIPATFHICSTPYSPNFTSGTSTASIINPSTSNATTTSHYAKTEACTPCEGLVPRLQRLLRRNGTG
ncbi:hypothetical protein BJV78DRAFT_1247170 [Lactifluus subvellereus]|nr:hypothetical protein BJV78DRAFT_1247170 [Lactifluus subvellereus]